MQKTSAVTIEGNHTTRQGFYKPMRTVLIPNPVQGGYGVSIGYGIVPKVARAVAALRAVAR